MIAHRGPGIRYFFRKFSTKITLKSVHFAHKTAVCYIRAAEKKILKKSGGAQVKAMSQLNLNRMPSFCVLQCTVYCTPMKLELRYLQLEHDALPDPSGCQTPSDAIYHCIDLPNKAQAISIRSDVQVLKLWLNIYKQGD